MEGAAVTQGCRGENAEKRIDMLGRLATDLHWKACQIRKTRLVYFPNPWGENGNEDFWSVGRELKSDPIT